VIALGVDPSSTRTGIALLRHEGSVVHCLHLGSVSTRTDRRWPALALRHHIDQEALPTVSRSPIDVLAIERPPPAALSDVARASQADVGWGTGIAAGIVLGLAEACSWRVQRAEMVPVSDWRATAITFCARRGLLLQRPRRGQPTTTTPRRGAGLLRMERVPERGLVALFRCGHTISLPNGYDDVVAGKTSACPECLAPKGLTEAEAVRDAWKALACSAVEHLWPGPFGALVLDARSRARTNPPPHRLVGVADACEAALVALHSIQEQTPGL